MTGAASLQGFINNPCNSPISSVPAQRRVSRRLPGRGPISSRLAGLSIPTELKAKKPHKPLFPHPISDLAGNRSLTKSVLFVFRRMWVVPVAVAISDPTVPAMDH